MSSFAFYSPLGRDYIGRQISRLASFVERALTLFRCLMRAATRAARCYFDARQRRNFAVKFRRRRHGSDKPCFAFALDAAAAAFFSVTSLAAVSTARFRLAKAFSMMGCWARRLAIRHARRRQGGGRSGRSRRKPLCGDAESLIPAAAPAGARRDCHALPYCYRRPRMSATNIISAKITPSNARRKERRAMAFLRDITARDDARAAGVSSSMTGFFAAAGHRENTCYVDAFTAEASWG